MSKENEIFAIWINKPGTYMMPFLYECCIASWQVLHPDMKVIIYASEPEIKFNLLSRDTTEVRILEETFPGIMKAAEETIPKDVPSGMRFAHISDYIRYFILSINGGIYVDCDLVCIHPLYKLIEECKKEHTSIVMAYEDTQRICNAFLGCLDEDGQKFYTEIWENYKERYVKTSYTFNSIKYPMIIKNRYEGLIRILPFKEGMFYPNWEKNSNGDLTLLQRPDNPLSGYGVHLYNTDVKWKQIKQTIDRNLYTDNLDWWIIKHLNNCIDKYIDLMVKAEVRDVTKDSILSKNLTELYGEEYLEQFRKEV